MTDEAALDVASLKVADLKEELAKRNLPTNGLKKELSSRLQEAIDAGSKVQNAEVAAKEEVVLPAESTSIETQEAEHLTNGEASDSVRHNTTSDQKTGSEQDKETTKDEEVTVSTGVHGGEVAAPEEVDTAVEEEEAAAAAPANGSTSLADRLGGKKAGDDDKMEIELEGGFEAEMEVVSGDQPNIMSTEGGAIIVETQAVEEDNTELSSKHPGGLSPYTTPASQLSKQDTATSKALTELEEDSITLEVPSRSIYITGLVRPLTLPSLRAKAEEFGKLADEGVKTGNDIWLDGVKSHAYVTYQDQESAIQAKKALSGTVYPPETGKEIQVFYLPYQIIDQCIAIEELAWQEDRGKMEIRAMVVDASNSLRYSLHRVESGSSVRQLEATLPQPMKSAEHRGGTGHYARNDQSYDRGRYSGRGGREGNMPPLRSDYSSRHTGYPDNKRYEDHQSVNRWGPPRRGRDDYGREERGGGGGEYRGSREDRYSSSGAGLSRADERLRQVEARIRQDRDRGNRGFVDEGSMRSSSGYANKGTSYRPYPDRARFNDDYDATTSSRGAYKDRHRDYSPPARSRDEQYSERR